MVYSLLQIPEQHEEKEASQGVLPGACVAQSKLQLVVAISQGIYLALNLRDVFQEIIRRNHDLSHNARFVGL
jgi:hypothetical protein